MKSFALDEAGDLCLKNGDIEMNDGAALLRQTARTLLGTNRGEWFLDEDEGLDFGLVLGKAVPEGRLRDEVQKELLKLDENLVIHAFSTEREGRKLGIRFTAAADGKSVPVDVAIG